MDDILSKNRLPSLVKTVAAVIHTIDILSFTNMINFITMDDYKQFGTTALFNFLIKRLYKDRGCLLRNRNIFIWRIIGRHYTISKIILIELREEKKVIKKIFAGLGTSEILSKFSCRHVSTKCIFLWEEKSCER